MDGVTAPTATMPDDPQDSLTDPTNEAGPPEEATAAEFAGTDEAPIDGAPDATAPAEADSIAAEITPRQIVEAILFSTDSPLPPAKIAQVLGVGDARDVRKHIKALNELYEQIGLSFRIEEIAGGFQMMTLPAFNTWLSRLLRARQDNRLSSAAMETLAIVAYKQPVQRAEIESIRGVAAGDLLNRLREMNLVKIVGRAEDLGRPLLYGTTKRFLEVFGLANLEDLPKVEALREGLKGAGNTADMRAAVSPVEPPPSASDEAPAQSADASAADEQAAE